MDNSQFVDTTAWARQSPLLAVDQDALPDGSGPIHEFDCWVAQGNEIAHWESLVEGVKEVANLGCFSYKEPLNLWDGNFSAFNSGEQSINRVWRIGLTLSGHRDGFILPLLRHSDSSSLDKRPERLLALLLDPQP
jgi:hypothetical protein